MKNIYQNQYRSFVSFLVVVAIIFVIFLIRHKSKKNPRVIAEGFVGSERAYNTPEDIYDAFYASIYDQLFHIKMKNEFEIQELHGYFLSQHKDRDNVNILDLGCGTGHHLSVLGESFSNTTGIDQSEHMLKVAGDRCANSTLIHDDFMTTTRLAESTYTHILCYYFTIYYVEDKRELANRVRHWLKPGGVFAVHVVNRSKFDPILNAASPFPGFGVQKYSDRRITESRLVFNKFNYHSNFVVGQKNMIDQMDNPGQSKYTDEMEFRETFRFKKNNRVRSHVHKLKMPKIKEIIKVVEEAGLRYIGNSDLLRGDCEYQYILYFKKDKDKKKTTNNKYGNIDSEQAIIRPMNDESQRQLLGN